MITLLEQIPKVLKNQRVKVFFAVGGGTLVVAGLCALAIYFLGPKKPPLPTNITVGAYAESSLDGMTRHSTFSRAIQSTVHNEKLDSAPYIIDNNSEYQDYLEKYDTITVLEPEQVPLVDDWFKAGYCALVCTSEMYEAPVNMFVTMWCSDNNGSMKVVVDHGPINRDFVYSEDPSNTIQSSVVVFLPQDAVRQADNIEILFL